MRVTKQGVRNLDTKPAKHVHRAIPRTSTTRSGQQVTQMVCWCGHVEKHDEAATDVFERV